MSRTATQESSYDGGGDMMLLPDAIKLGLGDFIFYSVLVGRAAMYDMLTAYMGKHDPRGADILNAVT